MIIIHQIIKRFVIVIQMKHVEIALIQIVEIIYALFAKKVIIRKKKIVVKKQKNVIIVKISLQVIF